MFLFEIVVAEARCVCRHVDGIAADMIISGVAQQLRNLSIQAALNG